MVPTPAGLRERKKLRTPGAPLSAGPARAARTREQGPVRVAELAQRGARRMGVDATSDPRPTLVAAVVMSAVQTATVAWRADEPDAPSSVLVDRAFGLLEGGI